MDWSIGSNQIDLDRRGSVIARRAYVWIERDEIVDDPQLVMRDDRTALRWSDLQWGWQRRGARDLCARIGHQAHARRGHGPTRLGVAGRVENRYPASRAATVPHVTAVATLDDFCARRAQRSDGGVRTAAGSLRLAATSIEQQCGDDADGAW